MEVMERDSNSSSNDCLGVVSDGKSEENGIPVRSGGNGGSSGGCGSVRGGNRDILKKDDEDEYVWKKVFWTVFVTPEEHSTTESMVGLDL